MNIFVKATPPSKTIADLLVIYTFENSIDDLPFSSNLNSEIKQACQKEDFKGKEKQTLVLYTKGIIPSYKLAVVGLGKEKDFDLSNLRKAAAETIRIAHKLKTKRLAVSLSSSWFRNFSAQNISQAVVEGIKLGGYKFLKYKSDSPTENSVSVDEVYLLSSPNRVESVDEGMVRGNIFADSTTYARDLINEPSAFTTPAYLADAAREIAKKSNNLISVKIYERDEAKKMGMGAFLGVAQGSTEPPKFIVLKYKSPGAGKKITVVGKGITFDTGGLSLKPAEHMMTMKMDMAGAASTLAIFEGLAKLKPKVNVVGIIAACENMPSGSALKPGDILKALNGKTIEVLNTDAEGRLTLADALSYAVKEKPDVIIDMATLTGACMVALGQEIAGLWGNNEKLVNDIKKAAGIEGEKVWPMPLPSEYRELIKSDVADLKNIQTGKYGGAITAALFLEEFVDDVPWVHMDIAGPAYEESETTLVPKGGAGFGVRTILQYLLTLG